MRKFSFEKWKPLSQSNAQIRGSWELGALSVWNENMRFLPDPELPAGSWELGENPYRMLRGTFGMIQGTFGMIQGTFDMIQGTFDMIQRTIDMIQRTFDNIQGTFSAA